MARGGSGRFSIALIGDKELERRLNAFESNVSKRLLKNAMKHAMKPALQAIKARVPVDTGRLRDSLKIVAWTGKRRQRGKFGFKVVTGTREELGIPEGAKGYYPFAVEAGHYTARSWILGSGGKRVPARPYMRPGFKAAQPQMLATLTQRMKENIRREAMKGGRADLLRGGD